MDTRYDAFCAVDRLFFDSMGPEHVGDKPFAVAGRPVPAGWQRQTQGEWLGFAPADPDLPLQGWKIHVSAGQDNAERVLGTVWDYCVELGVPFKFLRSPGVLLLRNSKYAPRAAAGKLATVYPRDTEQLARILADLGDQLRGEPGPYILSDLRWGPGPLYVRYGAFVERLCVGPGGDLVPALADPDGRLVPDSRNPVFTVPPWVTLPDVLAPHLAARNSATVAELPYRIDAVEHFSNGGGLYFGTDTRTDEPVVLKEARPYAGLDATGADAVRRLEREHEALRRLAGIPGIPRVHDVVDLGEHRFLVLERVEGTPLNRCVVQRYPLTEPDADEHALATYTRWALAVHAQVARTVAGIHRRGIVHGDLHMFNVMVRPDDSVVLLDFEVSSEVSDAVVPGLRNQGFAAPVDRTGAELDRYALACLGLALFLPLTSLLWLDRDKVYDLAEVIRRRFPVPPQFLDEAVRVIGGAAGASAPPPRPWPSPSPSPDLDPGPAAWPPLRDRLVAAITASATPQRDDRLFPGDIEQFRVGGLGIAYGAAGVLHAVCAAGADPDPAYEQWLAHRAVDPPPGTRIGLFDGLSGVAAVLADLGRRQEALDVAERCLREDWPALGPDLFGGVAGVGLALAHLADRTGEAGLRAAAAKAVDVAADQLRATEPPTGVSGADGRHAGLMRGWSGSALLFLRQYDDTGDPDLLDLAATALDHDLRRCVVRSGVLLVDEGWRTMPYLAEGSVGIGTVLEEYLLRRPDERFAVAADQALAAARAPLYVQSGLFAGRAGIISYLAGRRALRGPDAALDEQLAAQVRSLGWHAVRHRGGLAFPGEQLLRLSMDLATGTAGVLLALAAAQPGSGAGLPALGAVLRAGPNHPSREGGPHVPRPEGRR
jgi:Protein kinase domain